MGGREIKVAWRLGQRCLAIGILLLLFTISEVGGQTKYSITINDTSSALEYYLLHDSFHFASLIFDKIAVANRLILRPHPDRDEPNGSGSLLYVAPFLSGADSGGAGIFRVKEQRGGIGVRASGAVNAPNAGTFGTWQFSTLLSYHPKREAIRGSIGMLRIQLDDSLSVPNRDLNIYKLVSNYLHDASLQSTSGGFGDTGDIKEVRFAYSRGAKNFTWIPSPQNSSHFPIDKSNYLSVNAVGTVNNAAKKPNLRVTLIAKNSSSPIIAAGMMWDETQATNNVGVTPLVLKDSTSATLLVFRMIIRSTPPK